MVHTRGQLNKLNNHNEITDIIVKMLQFVNNECEGDFNKKIKGILDIYKYINENFDLLAVIHKNDIELIYKKTYELDCGMLEEIKNIHTKKTQKINYKNIIDLQKEFCMYKEKFIVFLQKNTERK